MTVSTASRGIAPFLNRSALSNQTLIFVISEGSRGEGEKEAEDREREGRREGGGRKRQ